MDKMPVVSENSLLEAAIEAARVLGVAVQIMPQGPHQVGQARPDVLVRINYGTTQYAVEVKRALSPSTLGTTLHQLERFGQQAMLVTDYVAPQLAEELKARHIAFLDLAGNAYIEQPGLLIWIKGQKPEAKPTPPTMGRAFQPTGLQVLFTLLSNPEAINRPYREIAGMAGVAHGTVGWVIPDLQKLGYVHDLNGKRGTRRLYEQERLINQWADAYARVLRPRTLIGRYYVATLDGWRDWALAEQGAKWGGEPSAAMLTNYLRPEVLTIYAEKFPSLLAARQKFMKEPTPGHSAVVEVRKRFWDFPGDSQHDNLVPPLLIYADLLATGDARCIETAKIIYDTYVTRLLTKN